MRRVSVLVLIIILFIVLFAICRIPKLHVPVTSYLPTHISDYRGIRTQPGDILICDHDSQGYWRDPLSLPFSHVCLIEKEKGVTYVHELTKKKKYKISTLDAKVAEYTGIMYYLRLRYPRNRLVASNTADRPSYVVYDKLLMWFVSRTFNSSTLNPNDKVCHDLVGDMLTSSGLAPVKNDVMWNTVLVCDILDSGLYDAPIRIK